MIGLPFASRIPDELRAGFQHHLAIRGSTPITLAAVVAEAESLYEGGGEHGR
jgi:hypothetical protein